jgi:hypothetical protein
MLSGQFYRSTIGWSLFYFVLDVIFTVEVIAVLIFNGDPLGILPNGATRAEECIFALALWICTELWSLKYGAFGALGLFAGEKREERKQVEEELRRRRDAN